MCGPSEAPTPIFSEVMQVQLIHLVEKIQTTWESKVRLATLCYPLAVVSSSHPVWGKVGMRISLGAFQHWHAIEFGKSDLHVGGTWGVSHGTNKTHLEFAFQALFLLFAKSVVQVWDRTWHLLREARPRFNIAMANHATSLLRFLFFRGTFCSVLFYPLL